MLLPILDKLAANDELKFYGRIQGILGEASSRGMASSTPTVMVIFDGLRGDLEGRSSQILSEISRVLNDAPIEDFDNLVARLKEEWCSRMQAAAAIASKEYARQTAFIVGQFPSAQLPSGKDVSDLVEKIRPTAFAEIDLFCTKLQDSQRPHLFLKAGEVFAGNRAARGIFTSAKKSLDLVDAYIGPEVFDMLEVTDPAVRIRIIGEQNSQPPKKVIPSAATKQAFHLFNREYGNRVEFRTLTNTLHDRFIIIDGTVALSVGHSIKDLGKKQSLINAVDPVSAIRDFEQLWRSANRI